MNILVGKVALILAAIVGIVMIVAPKSVGKKSLTETEKGVMTVRIMGVFIVIMGLIGFFALMTLN